MTGANAPPSGGVHTIPEVKGGEESAVHANEVKVAEDGAIIAIEVKESKGGAIIASCQFENEKNGFKIPNKNQLLKTKSGKIVSPPKLKLDENNLIPPDGGWAWGVLLGGFITLILDNFHAAAYSILFSPLWKEFRTDSTTISWIFNALLCVGNLTNLIAGPLCEEFGHRKIAFIGGVSSGLSIILTAFVPSPMYLFFTFSTLGGIGNFSSSSSIFIISKYFLRRRGFAFGIITLGTCIGGFVAPLLANFLLANYGFKGSCLIYGAIILNQCVSAVFYQPYQRHLITEPTGEKKKESCTPDPCRAIEEMGDKEIYAKEEREIVRRNKLTRKTSETSQYSTESKDQSINDIPSTLRSTEELIKRRVKWSQLQFIVIFTRILKLTLESLKSLWSFRVIFIAVSAGCRQIGYDNFQMWIPFIVRHAGHTLEQSAWCLSLAAIANTVSRLVVSLVVDYSWFNVRVAYITGSLLMSLSIAVFSFGTEYAFLATCVSCWGFSLGIAMSLYPISIINTVGEKLFPSVYGVSSIFIAVVFIVIGPILGVIRDATSNYMHIIWVIASISFLAVPLWILMPLAAKFDKKRENKTEGESTKL